MGFWDEKVTEILYIMWRKKWHMRKGDSSRYTCSSGYYLCNLFDHHWIFHKREGEGEFPENTSREKWPLARQLVITLDSVLQWQMKAGGREYLLCVAMTSFAILFKIISSLVIFMEILLKKCGSKLNEKIKI